MSDAPERIWVDEDSWFSKPTKYRSVTEYVRADLVERLLKQEEKAAEKAEACFGENYDALKAKLAKAVEDAYAEGFAEGAAGDWIEGDYSKPWAKSQALAELTGG